MATALKNNPMHTGDYPQPIAFVAMVTVSCVLTTVLAKAVLGGAP